MVLEKDAANALLRSLLPAGRSGSAGDPAHLMGFVEGDDPFEVRAGPVEDLLETAMVAADGPQCRIGDEKDALFEGDGFVDRPVRQGLDVGCKAPARGPVAQRVFEQRLVLRVPPVETASLVPAVEDAVVARLVNGSCW